jgi:hypothetical protein
MYEKCDRLQRGGGDRESRCWLEDRFQRFDDSGFGVMVAWAILILQGFNYFLSCPVDDTKSHWIDIRQSKRVLLRY